MFSNTSIIKDVNIVNKVICLFIALLIFILWKAPLFLLFVDILFLLVTKQFRKLFIFNLVITGLIVLNLVFPHFLLISKFLLFILYTILLSRVTKIVDLRYVIEVSLYRFHQKKITYKLFYYIYFWNNFIKQFKKMLSLKDDYEMKLTPSFLVFIIKQSYVKAKLGKQEFLEINNQRFYNYSSSRTYIDKVTWESWDNTYLICHVVAFLITIFYGR